MKPLNIRCLTRLALLLAIEIILSRFLSVSAWNVKIGFSFIPVALAALLYGPAAGSIIAGLGDFIGALLFPIGAYFPGFTVTALCTGWVLGALLHKKQSLTRILCAVVINQFIFSLLINSLWISLLYSAPYQPLLSIRIVQCFVLTPMQVAGILLLVKLRERFGDTLHRQLI